MAEIYELKRMVSERMQHAAHGSADRMDLSEMEVLADIYKDLCESEEACAKADYYQTVADAMPDGASGYMPDMGMGYGPNGEMTDMRGSREMRSGYRDSRGRYATRPRMRRGYDGGPYGHMDSIDGIIEEYEAATPEEKDELKRRLRPLLGM